MHALLLHLISILVSGRGKEGRKAKKKRILEEKCYSGITKGEVVVGFCLTTLAANHLPYHIVRETKANSIIIDLVFVQIHSQNSPILIKYRKHRRISRTRR